jgi:cytochrome c oxidase assembly protein Cox11
MRNEAQYASLPEAAGDYFVSLCAVCLRQVLQNLENSSRPVVVFLFFVVE